MSIDPQLVLVFFLICLSGVNSEVLGALARCLLYVYQYLQVYDQ